jgi:serine protease Do
MKEMEAKVKKVVAKDTPAVVSLMGKTVPGAGSGTIVSADGLILTAAHVTQGNESMKVVFPDGKDADCKVLGADYKRDVSLCRIEGKGTYSFAELGDSDKLEVTTVVLAMGHPGGFDLRRTPPLRIGRISNKDLGGFLVSDAALINGDSGGPLFDLEGRVVGVHSSISESLSFNRCAPVNAAKADWERLLAGERWGRMLGSPNLVPGFDHDRATIGARTDRRSTNGVELMEVYRKSPLEAAGLKRGDVITKIGDDDIKTSQDLRAALDKAKPGDKLEITYQRDGAEQKAEVTLISGGEMNDRLDDQTPPPPRRGRRGGQNQ